MLRSYELVARVRHLAEGLNGGPLAEAAFELCAYHIQMLDSALRLEAALYKILKETESGVK